MCILDHTQITFCCLGRFLKKLADDQCSFITKVSICCINHYVHTAFQHGSELMRKLTLHIHTSPLVSGMIIPDTGVSEKSMEYNVADYQYLMVINNIIFSDVP